MLLAKGFAALPQLRGSPAEPQLTRSRDELLSHSSLDDVDLIKELEPPIAKATILIPHSQVRLQPFSSPLKKEDNIRPKRNDVERGPATSRDIPTGVDGSFPAHIRVAEEEMRNQAYRRPTLLAPLYSSLFPAPSETKGLHLTLTDCSARIISDIDNLVVTADVLSGAPVIFPDVFVKEY
ncbi:hypothetical protein B0H15DRAFT_954599 [Mycena belliarum]|uniref:Uncharacterized protein n=1 Tax=Mycena belliarum TaxID=1033014 RepID=A0AAD6TUA1_9AGAR|nr:hypothetical protein B0H15DRAFT_954599 [Mycena belliae]